MDTNNEIYDDNNKIITVECFWRKNKKIFEYDINKKKLPYPKEGKGWSNSLHFIDKLIPSPSLFSYYILWGDSTDINKNIKKLNRRLI